MLIYIPPPPSLERDDLSDEEVWEIVEDDVRGRERATIAIGSRDNMQRKDFIIWGCSNTGSIATAPVN